MTDTTDRPLVSFAVIAYNQERYIREAIEGAFAQTYEPLEIILSDDCSPDRTFDIMQEMAAAYDGPHKVVLNRNEPNLGIVPHVNRIFDLASGELICVNAGDDFSRHDRVEVLHRHWVINDRRPDIVHTSAYDVSEKSEIMRVAQPRPNSRARVLLPKTVAREFVTAIGATFMYTKRLFLTFGPIPDCAEVEDRPMIFRASLAGGLLFVDDPLVYHRVGGASFAKTEEKDKQSLFGDRIKFRSWRVSSARCYLKDIAVCEFNCEDIDQEYLRHFIRENEWETDLYRSSFLGRLMMMPEAFARSYRNRSFRPLKSYVKYLAWPVYPVHLYLKNKLQKTSTD